jgi:recombination protein RecA
VDVIVVDSVAALVPRAELEGEMGEAHVGLQARLMSQALRKLTGAISKSRTAVIFINQIRERVSAGAPFVSPEVTPGGRALKFYASVRIDVRRVESLKQGQDPVGMRVKAKVVKNKLAPPFRQAEFDLLYGQGISREGELLDLGLELGFVQKLGAWYSFEDEKLGQGKENAREFLRHNPEVAGRLEERIRGSLNGGAGQAIPLAVTATAAESED